jgi:hypothetical protein
LWADGAPCDKGVPSPAEIRSLTAVDSTRRIYGHSAAGGSHVLQLFDTTISTFNGWNSPLVL